jgi:hypothetical protein
MMTRQSLLRWLAAVALLVSFAAACESSVSDRILSLDAEGAVLVAVFVDDNDNGQYNPTPAPGELRPAGVQVNLQLRGSPDLIPGGVTDTAGLRAFRVPIGRYRAYVDPAVLGDSLLIASGTQEFTVGENDSIGVVVALTFQTRSISELRALPLGKKTWVRGVVMNVPSALGDSTVHLSDSTVAIRTSGVRPQLPIATGDTVRFLGRRTDRDGQPSMLVSSIIVEAVGNPTPADSLSTRDASTASSGARDARLVRIAAAMVSDTITVSGLKTMTVDDGSGPLFVVLPPTGGFNPLTQWRPGISIDAVGLLVPNPLAPGTWILKPRNRPDLTILP